jgi:uncharacterized protein YyaL (SSP411 family)
VGGFYDTGHDHEELVIRPRDVFDNAQPCGGSVATDILLKIAVVTGNDDFAGKASTPLRALLPLLGRTPSATGHWLGALDFYVSLPKEVVIVGPSGHAETRAMLGTVGGRFLPNRVVVGVADPDSLPIDGSPLLEQRGMQDGQPTAYVCQHYVCQLPVTTAEALATQLDVR